jgi:phage tail-like protein
MSGPLTSIGNVYAIEPHRGYALNGNGHIPYEDEEVAPSKLLDLLPAIYSADPFVGRFLRIFEDVLQPISMLVDNQPYYFDPMTSPVDLLDYMAIWVDMDDEGQDWPLAKRRALITAAAAIFRMRGTRAGMKKHLGIYLGEPPLMMERTNGFRLDSEALLGINTSIGETEAAPSL